LNLPASRDYARCVKLLIEAAWALVIFGAFLACLYSLRELGASATLQAWLAVSLGALLWATWHTHWKR